MYSPWDYSDEDDDLIFGAGPQILGNFEIYPGSNCIIVASTRKY
jgi:hypothetical protein